MAQLVKLADYVSRYENDLSRYPTQFIRLKRHQWERIKLQWELGEAPSPWQSLLEEEQDKDESAQRKWYSPFLRIMGKKEEEQINEEIVEEETEQDEEFDFILRPNTIYQARNEDELRRLYINQLFQFQIKWASSTLLEKSRVDPRFYRDQLLRSFMQSLPDSFFIYYYPIVKLQKAPVELDILILTPLECICINVLEEERLAAYIGTGERFWMKKSGDIESKVLNPLIGLNRMEKIVKGILASKQLQFPIRKVVLSRNGYIDYPGHPFDVEFVDRRNYDEWFQKIRSNSSPMKSSQFKVAQAILENGQTTAMSRLFGEQEEVEEEQVKMEFPY